MNKHRPAAILLRRKGYSYAMINKELGVSKSTLSNWFRNAPFTPNAEVLKRIASGQGAYGLRRREHRLSQINRELEIGKEEIGKLTKRDLWMIGLGIWIGEGSKTIEQIRVVNSDPQLISLWLLWLRKICELDDTNVTVAMHLYPDSDEQVCRLYWQKITKLPSEQFRKTQFDKRPNKNSVKLGKLPYGTLHVTVVSNGDPERGVKLFRRLKGWISGILIGSIKI